MFRSTFSNSFRVSFRLVYALLLAFIIVTGAVVPAYAQSTPSDGFAIVDLFKEGRHIGVGRHNIADDFAIPCQNPGYDLKDPNHPCNTSSSIQRGQFDDLVLVCPIVGDLGAQHPCGNESRQVQIKNARPSDLVVVCPVEEVLEKHPCGESNASMAQFETPKAYVLTCPTKPVLDPSHPCSRSSH